MSRVAVTGAGGFVGRGLVPALRAAGHSVVALGRRDADVADPGAVTPDLFADTDAVVHLAGLAHRDDAAADALHAVNAGGADNVARAARSAGVARLILLSTALVHGPRTQGAPLTEASPLAPADAYAASKLAAERAVAAHARAGGLAVCVLRPPLIYGPDAGGNLARLAAWARRGLPMPTAVRNNRRSLLARANLVSAIGTALDHPGAAGRTFLVSDGPAVTTGELYAALCRAHGRRPRWLPVPGGPLRLGLRALGRGRDLARLLADFELDSGTIRAELNWSPPVPWSDAATQMPVA